MLIKNFEELTSHGNRKGRATVLEIIEAGLQAADPYPNVLKMLKVEDGKLLVGHPDFADRDTASETMPLVFDLSKVGNIYVFGGGKAVQRIAEGIEDALGDLVTGGEVNAKKGEPLRCRKIHVNFAGHPLPDADGVAGAQRKHEMESQVQTGDIVFYLSSGGGTATLAWPAPGLTLEDIREVTRLLYFEKGASMPEKNLVLAKLRMPRSGNTTKGVPMIYISSSETPPGGYVHHRKFPSRDAIDILKRYGLWNEVPSSVRSHLERVHTDPRFNMSLIPIHSAFLYKETHTFRVVGPEYALEAARAKAEELGVHAHILCSSLNDIEMGDISGMLANLAREVDRHGHPFQTPCVLIFGGEPTVSTGRATGKGGRNLEFALAAAPWIEGYPGIVAASVDTDGSDGPTEVAGGIADGDTMARAQAAGIDFFAELDNHNSYEVMTRLDDTVVTGQLGQNLRSLCLVFVDAHNGREMTTGVL